MRVILTVREKMLPLVNICLARLTAIVQAVSSNPSNPQFNHYVFESIGALIRYSHESLILAKSFPAHVPLTQPTLLFPTDSSARHRLRQRSNLRHFFFNHSRWFCSKTLPSLPPMSSSWWDSFCPSTRARIFLYPINRCFPHWCSPCSGLNRVSLTVYRLVYYPQSLCQMLIRSYWMTCPTR